MKDGTDYIFPHNNWCLEFTEEERPLVNNWRINIIKYSTDPCPTNFIDWRGFGLAQRRVGLAALGGLGVKISFFQFKKYVLNIEDESISTEPENYNYLIKILNNKQIK